MLLFHCVVKEAGDTVARSTDIESHRVRLERRVETAMQGERESLREHKDVSERAKDCSRHT